MKITLKLYASLKPYLPDGTPKNETTMELPEGTTVQAVIDGLAMPEGLYKLVLVNGIFVLPEERATQAFTEGDVLAMWPPVAGG